MADDRSGGAPIALALTGVLAAGVVAGWFASRGRQAGIDARTRDRLAPRAPEPRVPSAADIHVG